MKEMKQSTKDKLAAVAALYRDDEQMQVRVESLDCSQLLNNLTTEISNHEFRITVKELLKECTSK